MKLCRVSVTTATRAMVCTNESGSRGGKQAAQRRTTGAAIRSAHYHRGRRAPATSATWPKSDGSSPRPGWTSSDPSMPPGSSLSQGATAEGWPPRW